MKIVINACFGGFGLSQKACEKLKELGVPVYTEDDVDKIDCINYMYLFLDRENELNLHHSYGVLERTDPRLIKVVEELGEEANGDCAKLRVIDLPKDVQHHHIYIEEYDGNEHIAEKHRTWYAEDHSY